MSRHVHLHLGDAFKEAKHPRGKGGKFSKGGAASGTTEEQRHQQRIKTAHSLGVEPEHMYPEHRRRFSDPRLKGEIQGK
jgi:hypothetical protein